MRTLYAEEKGQGHPLLLIHGFPMNAAIWNTFSDQLQHHCRVITIDLPGFGKSPLPEGAFSIDTIADLVLQFLEARELSNVVVLGHSLGGYITLSMMARQPARFAGYGLFHSTAYADADEKKLSRSKTIEFVEKNGAEAFTANFISPLFANKQHPAIEDIRAMNKQASLEAIVGYTKAMRDRPDRCSVLAQVEKPVLFISGAEDPGIPVASIHAQAKLAVNPTVHILDAQAHMAMIEAPDVTARLVAEFMYECYP